MTKEEAKEYIDNYISHIISMTEYGNWFALKVKEYVDIAKSECDKIIYSHKCATTKKICNTCQNEIDEVLTDLEDKVTSLIEKEVMKLSEEEKEWLKKYVASPLGLDFNYSDKASKLLLLIPVVSVGIIGQYGNTLSERLKTIYNQEIMTSYVSGLSFEDLEDSYTPRFKTFERNVQTESENIGSSLSSQYDRIIYTKNDKKIKGYLWSAILDAHTCLVCGSLDGQKFTDIDKIPMYPVHLNCRCTLIPFTENIEDMIPETYSEWFEHQSNKEKRNILGKTRFELYEEGIKIKNFVNNGKVTPLKDLK